MTQRHEQRGLETPQMSDAAIYARVSTEDPSKDFSTPTQIEACQKLARQVQSTRPLPGPGQENLTNGSAVVRSPDHKTSFRNNVLMIIGQVGQVFEDCRGRSVRKGVFKTQGMAWRDDNANSHRKRERIGSDTEVATRA